MDLSDLIIEYSAGDFADAYRGLLPQGEYWQDLENPELANTIKGIAKDFKQTHDDIELSLLTNFDQPGFGWKLRDYQHLLDSMGGNGWVSDDITRPNLIVIDLLSVNNSEVISAFESVRLPHTQFHWLYQFRASTQFVLNTAFTFEPHLHSQLDIHAETQLSYCTALIWQLEIGDPE